MEQLLQKDDLRMLRNLPLFLLMFSAAVSFSQDQVPNNKAPRQKTTEPALHIVRTSPNEIAGKAEDMNLPRTNRLNIVVATHGWIELEQWPKDLAVSIQNKVDANKWLCGWFDWRNESRVINPLDAAQYARDSAGAIMAEQILKISKNPEHVHLIGHSAGCWAISEAAKIIAKKTKADIHLTFLDAYVPIGWDANSLGNISAEPNTVYWADHYLTEDITGKVTYCILDHAHNVDIGEVTPGLKDHKFPFYWYPATVLGKYALKDKYSGERLYCKSGGIEYGFTRSLEAGEDNWQKSLKLPMGNNAVKLTKPQEQFDSFNWLFKKLRN